MKLWIARDYRGLYIFENKPQLIIDIFHSFTGFILLVQNNKFPEVTFENSPQQVEIKLDREEEFMTKSELRELEELLVDVKLNFASIFANH